MAEVSVIMPVYNAEKYLRSSIESVLSQGFRDLELIAVDDGSSDSSGAICDEYAAKDPRFRVIHKPNGGPAAARNAALDAATGTYLMFCDSDDEYHPDFCGRMVDLIRTNPVDLVAARNDFIREDGITDEYFRERIGEGDGLFNEFGAGIAAAGSEARFWGINVLLWNKIFRRDLVVKFGIRFPEGHENDDDAFCYEYAMVSGDALQITDELYHYRLRLGSIADSYVARRPKNRYDRIAVADFLTDFAVRNGIDRRHSRFFVRLWLETYRMVAPFFDAEELKELRRDVLAKAAGYESDDCRLVETDGTIVWINHRGGIGDLVKYLWHRLRAAFAPDAERRRRIMLKAERSRLLWRTK